MNLYRLKLTAAALCLGIWLSGCGQAGAVEAAGEAHQTVEADSGKTRETGEPGGMGGPGASGGPEDMGGSGASGGQEGMGGPGASGGQESLSGSESSGETESPGGPENFGETDSGKNSLPETEPGETVSVEAVSLPVIPSDDSLVRVQDYIPDILTDLKYASEDNFTGQRIYDFTEAYLRYGTIEKLKKAQEAVKEYGMLLKIWDAYRPVSAQFKLWDICPDPVYVANPNKGFSSHSRGNTVDITLVREDGTEVEMPTGFDDFSLMADRDYSDCAAEAAENARLLERIMKECGFKPYSGEWWHFSDENSYPVEEAFEPEKMSGTTR